MDRLSLLETFAVALEEGSLNRASHKRGITQSAVSQQIKQLESLMGQQLLHRTAKGVQATRAGTLIYPRARTLLREFGQLEEELRTLNEQVSGTLRLSVSNALGRSVVGPMLIELNKTYPDLNINMRLEDRLVDVVRENYDLAIRTGQLGDTDGIGRKITSLETVLFATPAYLDQTGRPKTPDDLKNLKMVRHNEDQPRDYLPMYRGNSEHLAPLQVGFTASDPDLIQMAVDNDTGYARIPKFLIQEQLAMGVYEVVLPEYRSTDKPVFAVYPSRHDACKRQEVILKSLVERLADLQNRAAQKPSALRVITA